MAFKMKGSYFYGKSPFKNPNDLKKIFSRDQLAKITAITRQSQSRRKATIRAPRHLQQAKAASLLNPVASIFAGGAAIVNKIRGKA